jgi:hypothetical protein
MNPNLMSPFKADTKTSVTLDQATQYHLSLNLEWLKGCQFSCKGCHVNKDAVLPYDAIERSKLGAWLYSMTHEGNYLPTIVFLAPTDFLSASNTAELLDNPDTYSILSKFRRLSLQTTYLDISKAEEIVKILRKHYSHMELELNFIIEPEQIGNDKYLSRIKENRNKIYELLNWTQPVLSFAIMNVYEYDRVKKNDVKKLLADYQALHDKIGKEFGTTIDFNFSMLRNSWWSNEDVEEAVKSISRIFDQGVNHEFNQTIRFSFGKLTDSLIEKHYNWHQGSLYASPMLYERIVSFHEDLRIPLQEHTVKETETSEGNLLVKQYENVDDKDCATCRYQASCIDRNILTFMDMHDIKKCIIARDALDAINKLD